MQKENIKKNEMNTSLPILPISSVAAALNVHQRTLRIYDTQGILCPKRTEKNRRNYSLDDLEKGKLILFLTRNLAMNLSGVKLILAMVEDSKIEPSMYIEYVEKLAKIAGIDTKVQENNIEKTAKRGRKPKAVK